MTDIQIFNNPDFGDIRTVEIDGEAWFVGKDVAGALGYAKPLGAVSTHVEKDDSLKRGLMDSLGRE
nr:MAG TPA: antirepressor [Bacteriophage sp.]